MSAAVQQLADGRPYAETSWGGFGQGFIVVSATGAPTPPTPPSGGGNRMGGDRAIRRSPVGR